MGRTAIGVYRRLYCGLRKLAYPGVGRGARCKYPDSVFGSLGGRRSRLLRLRPSNSASARSSLFLAIHLYGGWEQVPAGDEQGGEQGANHKAVQTEYGESAQRRDQDYVVGYLGVLAHEQGPEDVVDQSDHQHSEKDQYNAFPCGPCDQEVDGNRHPDQG